MPDRVIMPIMGDGTFHFSNPQSIFAVSQKYGLPIFVVVLDNSGWGAVKEATLRVYPAGDAKAEQRVRVDLWSRHGLRARSPKRAARMASWWPSLQRSTARSSGASRPCARAARRCFMRR